MALSFAFDSRKGETPETLRRKRRAAEAFMGNALRPAKDVGEGLSAIGNALVYRALLGDIAGGEALGNAARTKELGKLYDFAPAPGKLDPVAAALAGKKSDTSRSGSTIDFANAGDGSSTLTPTLAAALDKTEGGGDYDTLFGHAQREGGSFAGTRVSEMPISDVLAFQDPGGTYGQSVKAKIGRVATPAGRHQIVGTTLRNAVAEMGIDPSTPFNRDTQDSIAMHLARKRVQSADSLDGKIAALRNEWEGLRSVPNSQMAMIVAELEGAPAAAPRRPTQVASLDPSIGLPEEGPVPMFPRPRQEPAAAPQAAPAQQQAPQQQPVQMAQADSPEAMGFGPAVNSPAGAGARIMQLRRAMTQQWLSDDDRAMIAGEIQQLQQSEAQAQRFAREDAQRSQERSWQLQDRQAGWAREDNDPLRALQLRKAQLELDAKERGDGNVEFKVVNDRLIKTFADGRAPEDVTPEAPEGSGPSGPFSGSSVEAQSLNWLVENGKLTPEQAAQLGAGKQITDPSTGAIMFMTPQGIFSQQPGQPAQPVQSGGGSRLLSPSPLGPGSSPAQPQQPVPAETPRREGMIPLTPPKERPVPDATRNKVANVNQAFDAIGAELDRYAELVGKTGIEAVPGDSKDNLNTVRQGIMLQMKELFNLGVLNGPDLALMERMIYDPVVDPFKDGGLRNLPDQLYTAARGGAGERAANSVTELKRMLTNIRDTTNRAAGTTQGAPAGRSFLKSKYGLE